MPPLFRESLCLLLCNWSLWVHSSGSDVIPDMSWISVNQTSIDWPSSFYSTYPCWSMYLNLIHRYGNHNSFELKPRIISMLLSSDAFAFFLLMVEYRYSYQTLCTPPDLWWIIFRLILHGFFYVSSGFIVWNTSLALDDLCYHRQPPLTHCQCKLGHVYRALLSLGKDRHLILVYHHIFLSIGLFNLSFGVTYLSSDNSLLM